MIEEDTVQPPYTRGMFFRVLDWGKFLVQVTEAGPHLTGVHLGGEPANWHLYLGINNKYAVTEEDLNLWQAGGIIQYDPLFDLNFDDTLVGMLVDAIL